MASPTNEIRSVIVAGRGPLAWIAALGLWRVFRHRQLEVQVVDTGPSDDARIGFWTLPSQRGMHALLGIQEPHLVEQTGATFKLATQHQDWQGEGSRFLHAHGEIGRDIGSTPFYKLIQREVLAGRPERPEAFSVAAAAAHSGKFARPMGDGSSLTSSFTYGFHFQEETYTQYLRSQALRQGVKESSASLAEVSLGERGDIHALRLADGSTVAADFFLDCSGPAARLLGSVSTGEREDWSAWLPCDRMWSALGPRMNDPPAMTQTWAREAGWSWRAPLSQASMIGQVFSSRFQDEAAALSALCAMDPALRGDPVLTRFSAGRRRQVWQRNCVALGAAAIELEPLAGADLHLAQIGLATFIEFFPRDAASAIEAAEYNHLMAEHADALRDFTLAH
jgi:tryptophan halogenase